MNKITFLCPLVFVLAGCVQPPATPAEKAARQWAGAELAATKCAGYIGGFSAAKDMRNEAKKDLVEARELGATDELLAKAKTDVNSAATTSEILIGVRETCNQLVSQLAYHSS